MSDFSNGTQSLLTFSIVEAFDSSCNLLNDTSHAPKSIEERSCALEFQSSSFVQGVLLVTYTIVLFSIFVGIAIICDEYFVPSLELISEKFNLSEAVAGATFMAMGSSAPELFTACIAMLKNTDVGVGTVTGSAIFNLLLIIAASAFFVREELILDWRPLIRDSVYYGLSLLIFIYASWDTYWTLFESLLMVSVYALYLIAMVFDDYLMQWLANLKQRKIRNEHSGHASSLMKTLTNDSIHRILVNRSQTISIIHKGDPSSYSVAHSITAKRMVVSYSVRYSKVYTRTRYDQYDVSSLSSDGYGEDCCPQLKFSAPEWNEDERETSKAVSILTNMVKWICFIAGVPHIVVLNYLVPDCSKPHLRRFVLVTFSLSMMYIALLTYGMVELIVRIGCIIGVDAFVMSIVFMAAGTSIPDMFSSIIVAKEGHGDMAVSNALGSNVFDLSIGIGLPMLVTIAIAKGQKQSILNVKELSHYCKGDMLLMPHPKFGFILFAVLCFVVVVINGNKYRITPKLGCAFIFTYILFLTYAFVQEFVCTHYNYIC